jgi:hypothetical protein
MNDNQDPDLQRALRTAMRSVEAAQADVSSDLAVEHLTGAVYQLAFVVGRLMDDLTKIKSGATNRLMVRPSRHSAL